ncbi:hypothetical protein T06_6868 [Trichinella sp. T6]|nr:hypothetical protein T06_6868 [Trichinella sp. T6]
MSTDVKCSFRSLYCVQRVLVQSLPTQGSVDVERNAHFTTYREVCCCVVGYELTLR